LDIDYGKQTASNIVEGKAFNFKLVHASEKDTHIISRPIDSPYGYCFDYEFDVSAILHC
jgi:hypothetical protein